MDADTAGDAANGLDTSVNTEAGAAGEDRSQISANESSEFARELFANDDGAVANDTDANEDGATYVPSNDSDAEGIGNGQSLPDRISRPRGSNRGKPAYRPLADGKGEAPSPDTSEGSADSFMDCLRRHGVAREEERKKNASDRGETVYRRLVDGKVKKEVAAFEERTAERFERVEFMVALPTALAFAPDAPPPSPLQAVAVPGQPSDDTGIDDDGNEDVTGIDAVANEGDVANIEPELQPSAGAQMNDVVANEDVAVEEEIEEQDDTEDDLDPESAPQAARGHLPTNTSTGNGLVHPPVPATSDDLLLRSVLPRRPTNRPKIMYAQPIKPKIVYIHDPNARMLARRREIERIVSSAERDVASAEPDDGNHNLFFMFLIPFVFLFCWLCI